MRTDLNNSTFKLTPNLVNKTETKTVEIPFETNVNLIRSYNLVKSE